MSTILPRFAKVTNVGAGQAKLFSSSYPMKITSGPLTVCTYFVALVRPKVGNKNYYMFAHFSDSCTAQSMRLKYQAELYEKGLVDSDVVVETIGFRTAPDTQVRIGPNCGVDTTVSAYKFANLVSGQPFDQMYKITAQAPGSGLLMNECVVSIPKEGVVLDLPVKPGLWKSLVSKIPPWRE